MGLLDKLWDDTLAGPRPETGLGRLRKYSSLSIRPPAPSKDEATSAAANPAVIEPSGMGGGMSFGREEVPEVEPRVTRSIMIKRPPGWSSPANGTPPSSPAGYTPPISPFSGPSSVGREWNRMRRKYSSDAYGRREAAVASNDWSSSYPPFEV